MICLFFGTPDSTLRAPSAVKGASIRWGSHGARGLSQERFYALRLCRGGDTTVHHALAGLRFMLLTAVRSGEARGTRWSEMNLQAAE